MKRKRYQQDEERTILTGIIVHDDVASGIMRHMTERRPFKSKWTNLVFGWCMTYWKAHKRAPKRHLLNLFGSWQKKNEDDELVGLVEKFLTSLDDDYQREAAEINPQFVIDTAGKYFRSVQLGKMAEEIERSLEVDDLEAAEEKAHQQPIQFGQGTFSDMFDADTTIAMLENNSTEQLIKFPGALGEFMENMLCRDAFVSFAGPEKRGKSYWLQEIVYQAVRQRRKTLYFVVGDMTEPQVRRRFTQRLMRHPLKRDTLNVPTRMRVDSEGETRVKTEEIVYDPATPRKIKHDYKAFMEKTRVKTPRLKLMVELAGAMSVSDIQAHVEDCVKADWVPDVIVIDYADVLSPPPHALKFDYRHQINETWIALRALSQEFHCLVVTATQTAATSYDAKVIRKTDFSEDKRKAAHITGMVGINQTADEKLIGAYRLNWIFQREGFLTENQCVHTAGQLGIANPVIKSAWRS